MPIQNLVQVPAIGSTFQSKTYFTMNKGISSIARVLSMKGALSGGSWGLEMKVRKALW